MKTITFGFDFLSSFQLDKSIISDAELRFKKFFEAQSKAPLFRTHLFDPVVDELIEYGFERNEANTLALVVWFLSDSLHYHPDHPKRVWSNSTAKIIRESAGEYFLGLHNCFKARKDLKRLDGLHMCTPYWNMPRDAQVVVNENKRKLEEEIRHETTQKALNRLGGLRQELVENSLVHPRFFKGELRKDPFVAKEATTDLFRAFEAVDNGKHRRLYEQAAHSLRAGINLFRSINGDFNLLCNSVCTLQDCLRHIKFWFEDRLYDRVNNPELVELYETLAPA